MNDSLSNWDLESYDKYLDNIQSEYVQAYQNIESNKGDM